MDVAGVDRRHLPALDLRDAARRMKDEDRGPLAALDRLDGGGAGVSRSGADNRGAGVVALQKVVVEPAEHLKGDVLERERRPVEQLEQPVARAELRERRHGGVAEFGVRGVDDRAQRRRFDGVASEAGDDCVGDIGILAAAKRDQLVAGERRPPLRNVEPAVRREPGEEHALEVEDRRAAAGADVSHGGFGPDGRAANSISAGHRSAARTCRGSPGSREAGGSSLHPERSPLSSRCVRAAAPSCSAPA